MENDDYLSTLNEKEYNESYDNAVKTFDNYVKNIPSYEKNLITENEIQPMHPYIYYQLIRVQGFTKLNGNTYDKYLELWKKRHLKV